MALRLRVVGNQAKVLGDSATRVFGVHGGTIGRSGENDWVLPDPERYISGKHVRIEYRGGVYWLHDTSSNGTYLNNGTDPVSATGPYQLKDGDRLRMGDFDLAVSIDASNDFPPDRSALVAYDVLGESTSSRKPTAGDTGSSLNLDALLAADDSGARAQPVNAYGQAVVLEPMAPKPRVRPKQPAVAPPAPAPTPVSHKVPVPPRSSGSLLDSENGQVPWNLATRRIEPYKNPVKPAAAEVPRAPEAAPRPEQIDNAGLQMLCRGAGIDPATIPLHLQPQVLLVAGQILREMMFGLMDVQQSRTELRNRFRIANQGSHGPDEPAPMTFRGGVEESLRRLFEQRGGRYLGPAEAVRENFRDLKAHHQAVAAAMEAAFGEVMSRLDPAELEERFARGQKRSALLSSNKSRYWDLYAEFYPSLGVAPKGELPHLFVEEFARAYQAKMVELFPRQARAGSRRDEDHASATGND
jgi:type VI secretion system protein